MIGIVGIDHLHGSLGWRRFIAEQRNRLPEIPDKRLGIKTNIEVDIARQQARRDADVSRRIIACAPPDRLKAFFLPHGMEVAEKGFRQLASRTPRPAAGIAALADPPRWLQTGIDWGFFGSDLGRSGPISPVGFSGGTRSLTPNSRKMNHQRRLSYHM